MAPLILPPSVTAFQFQVLAEAAVQFAPTAATVPVLGRVLSAGGNGIARATVSITHSSGTIQSVKTNSFGYFQFDPDALWNVQLPLCRLRSWVLSAHFPCRNASSLWSFAGDLWVDRMARSASEHSADLIEGREMVTLPTVKILATFQFLSNRFLIYLTAGLPFL